MKKLFVVLLLLFVSCNSGDVNPVDFTVIAKGDLSVNPAINQREFQIVVTDTVAWNDLLSKIDIPRVSIEDTDKIIDFERETVLGIFDQVRPVLANSIEIMSVIELSDELLVTYRPRTRDEGYTALGQPFVIVKIPVSGKSVRFEKEEELPIASTSQQMDDELL